LRTLPPASALGSYNRFILAFWMTSGPADVRDQSLSVLLLTGAERNRMAADVCINSRGHDCRLPQCRDRSHGICLWSYRLALLELP
jgi:hypothetical protein